MSASPVFSTAAMSRPFIFGPQSSLRIGLTVKSAQTRAAEILARAGAISKLAASAVVPASRLDVRPAPEMVSSGIPQLDALTGGLARGCLTEICGAASSGRTSVLLVALARATQRGEVCALVDASDAFDPASAAASGMDMSRLLWVRCGEKYQARKYTEHKNSYQRMPSGKTQVAGKKSGFGRWQSRLGQMLKVTDLLLQSSGFGMIALDLSDVPAESARRIPLASWFRFRRAVEHTPTALLVIAQQPIAGSCSSALVKVSAARLQVSGGKLSSACSPFSGNRPTHLELKIGAELTHAELLDQFEITAELLRSRLGGQLERKPAQSITSFKSRAAWVG
ncbi:MAG: hypothetical protein WBW53_04060 [Terriglobales bacterium]